MTQTLASLDEPRAELIERPLERHREARDIATNGGGKNQVYFWKSTGSYTLNPINFTTDYVETAKWDGLKLLLDDFNHQDGVWKETYGEHDKDGPFDPYLSLIVDADDIPDGYPHDGSFLLTSIQGKVSPTPQINYQSQNAIELLTSKRVFPYNQGFMLRFYQEGRGSSNRGNALQFSFGQFILALNTNGKADLHQTADYVSYTLVHSFKWAEEKVVHNAQHVIAIIPHGRNKVEIISGSEHIGAPIDRLFYYSLYHLPSISTVYTIPGELIYNADEDIFNITDAATCAVFASREYRPYVQVGLIAYVNGGPQQTPGDAFIYDAPIDLDFPPLVDISGQLQFDSNGCNIAAAIYDPTLKQNWQPGKPSSQLVQFACEFYGNGIGPNDASTRTPELYSYTLTKGPLFRESKRLNILVKPSSYRFTGLGTGEHESVNITIPNGEGQVNKFTRRGKIPCAIGDIDSGLYLFEGTARKVHAVENLSQGRSISIEIAGMAEDLKRAHWLDNAPNFGIDPNDSKGRGYYWNEVVYRVFELAGFPRSSVVIEDGTLYDFRLWNSAGGGGAAEYKGKADSPGDHGDQHIDKGPINKFACFQPKSDSTPADFLAFLFEFLHWHWQWNTFDHSWHIYKRPIPTNPHDVDRMNNVRAVFIGDTSQARQYAETSPVPVYTHMGRVEESMPPVCAGVTVNAFLTESGLKNKEELAQALAQEQAGGGTAGESAFVTETRLVPCTLINKMCYASPTLNPNPDALPYGVDDLQFFSMRQFLTSAVDRQSLAWIARRSFYAHCFGHTWTTLNALWGDKYTLNFRKWDTVLIDSGKDEFGNPNGSLEAWQLSTIEPSWARDENRRADYRFSKLRWDAPAPY